MATRSVSGLSGEKHAQARNRAANAALLGYRRKASLHYTQGSRRWDGINKHLSSAQGECPHYADCSSFATWCLWNALYLRYRVRDTVNGLAWRAGYTGTMLNHGKAIRYVKDVRKGDLVIYGRRAPGAHVAIVVGWRNGKPLVVSHGSEAGPFLLPYNYRGDILSIRRYI